MESTRLKVKGDANEEAAALVRAMKESGACPEDVAAVLLEGRPSAFEPFAIRVAHWKALLYSATLSTSSGSRGVADMHKDILTIKDIAGYLKVTERTLYRLAQEGKIPGFKVGASWRFKRADIDAWLEAQKPSVADRDRAVGED